MRVLVFDCVLCLAEIPLDFTIQIIIQKMKIKLEIHRELEWEKAKKNAFERTIQIH